jgi:hypothetical protein
LFHGLSDGYGPIALSSLGNFGLSTYDKPETYLIEFSDREGCEYAMALLPADELLVVHRDLAPINLDLGHCHGPLLSKKREVC